MKGKIKKFMQCKMAKYILSGSIIVVLIVLVFAKLVTAKEGQMYEKKIYETEKENLLADAVRGYLEKNTGLDIEKQDMIADTAISNYNTIISSGVTSITAEYTEAVMQNIKNKFVTLAPEENVDVHASEITRIIWEFILEEIENIAIAGEPGFEEQYIALSESLQEQINAIKKRNLEVSITADITNTGIGQEELDDAKNELYESYGSDLDAALSDLYSQMDSMKSEVSKEITSVKSSVTDGKDGKNGTEGKNGKDGKDGEDGKDGIDGKTSFIRYATDEHGSNMSDAPTESTKYIGTYIGLSASSDPSDYNWIKYKDAVISYDKEQHTLYITQ